MDERVLLVQCVWRGYLGRREAARAQLVKERNSIKSRKKKGHAEKNEQFDDVAVFKAKKKTHRIQVNQLLSPSRVSSRLQESPEKGTPQLIEPIICDSHLQVIHEDSREFMRDSLNNTADPFVNTPAIAVINTECDEGEQEADSLDGDGEQDDASEDSLDGDGRGSAVDEDPYVIDEEEYRIMEEKRFNLIESMRTIEEKYAEAEHELEHEAQLASPHARPLVSPSPFLSPCHPHDFHSGNLSSFSIGEQAAKGQHPSRHELQKEKQKQALPSREAVGLTNLRSSRPVLPSSSSASSSASHVQSRRAPLPSVRDLLEASPDEKKATRDRQSQGTGTYAMVNGGQPETSQNRNDVSNGKLSQLEVAKRAYEQQLAFRPQRQHAQLQARRTSAATFIQKMTRGFVARRRAQRRTDRRAQSGQRVERYRSVCNTCGRQQVGAHCKSCNTKINEDVAKQLPSYDMDIRNNSKGRRNVNGDVSGQDKEIRKDRGGKNIPHYRSPGIRDLEGVEGGNVAHHSPTLSMNPHGESSHRGGGRRRDGEDRPTSRPTGGGGGREMVREDNYGSRQQGQQGQNEASFASPRTTRQAQGIRNRSQQNHPRAQPPPLPQVKRASPSQVSKKMLRLSQQEEMQLLAEIELLNQQHRQQMEGREGRKVGGEEPPMSSREPLQQKKSKLKDVQDDANKEEEKGKPAVGAVLRKEKDVEKEKEKRAFGFGLKVKPRPAPVRSNVGDEKAPSDQGSGDRDSHTGKQKGVKVKGQRKDHYPLHNNLIQESSDDQEVSVMGPPSHSPRGAASHLMANGGGGGYLQEFKKKESNRTPQKAGGARQHMRRNDVNNYFASEDPGADTQSEKGPLRLQPSTGRRDKGLEETLSLPVIYSNTSVKSSNKNSCHPNEGDYAMQYSPLPIDSNRLLNSRGTTMSAPPRMRGYGGAAQSPRGGVSHVDQMQTQMSLKLPDIRQNSAPSVKVYGNKQNHGGAERLSRKKMR